MPRIRKIKRMPALGKNYYVIDANFLANKYIQPSFAPDDHERTRIVRCLEWWSEIDSQIHCDKARVYIPDICIAETFKVLAKKYYKDNWFTNSSDLSNARKRLIKDITIPARTLCASRRRIRYHDISTSRDIIIAVDRFYEAFMKNGIEVQIADLILLATAKYLIDFFDIPKKHIQIITLDRHIRSGSTRIPEIPNAYDPTLIADHHDRIFLD